MVHSLYIQRATFLHALDPRTKLLGFIVLAALPFVFNNPLYEFGVVVVLICLGALAGALVNYYRARVLMASLLLGGFVAWQFYLSGQGHTPIGSVGPVKLTTENLEYGLSSGLRLVAVLMVGNLFISITSVEEVTAGLVGIGIPFSVGLVIGLTVRLLPLMLGTLTGIYEAQVARGLNLDTRNPFQKLRRMVPIIVPFLAGSMRNASALAMALESRGFTPSGTRTFLLEFHLRRSDYLALAGSVLFFGACLVWRLSGHGAVLPGRL